MQRLLWAASDQARACLMAGLLAGMLLPGVAAALVPWLPAMVAGLLTTTALRIGHREALGALGDLRWGLLAVLALQLALPLVAFLLLSITGLLQTPAALAILLVLSAPAITGSVNLALIMGLNAGRAMQILVLGTALFPLTILPILALLPQLGPASTVLWAAARLTLVILGAACIGFALRRWLFRTPTEAQIKALDGLSVLTFAFTVVGLMAALNPALRSDPWAVLNWTLLAFALGYLMQLFTLLALRRSRLSGVAGPLSIAAGNRNVAIFLVALPAEVLAPLMIFIGAWQLPMYLTPLLLPRLYACALGAEHA